MGGQRGQTAPPDTKNREGEQKSGRGKRGKGKKKEGKEEKREKGRKKREKEKRKGKRKRERKREKGKERKREEKKGEREEKGERKRGKKGNEFCVKVITKLREFSIKIPKSSSFWGGHIPPQAPPPCARKRAIGANAPPGSSPTLPPRTVRAGYAPGTDSLTNDSTSGFSFLFFFFNVLSCFFNCLLPNHGIAWSVWRNPP